MRNPDANWKAPVPQVYVKPDSLKPVGRFGTHFHQNLSLAQCCMIQKRPLSSQLLCKIEVSKTSPNFRCCFCGFFVFVFRLAHSAFQWLSVGYLGVFLLSGPVGTPLLLSALSLMETYTSHLSLGAISSFSSLTHSLRFVRCLMTFFLLFVGFNFTILVLFLFLWSDLRFF